MDVFAQVRIIPAGTKLQMLAKTDTCYFQALAEAMIMLTCHVSPCNKIVTMTILRRNFPAITFFYNIIVRYEHPTIMPCCYRSILASRTRKHCVALVAPIIIPLTIRTKKAYLARLWFILTLYSP